MDEFGMNLEEVREVIDTAEVLVIRFAILEKRLLLDARHNENEAPLLQLVPKASSVEERFRSLKQLRPHFVLPDNKVDLLANGREEIGNHLLFFFHISSSSQLFLSGHYRG